MGSWPDHGSYITPQRAAAIRRRIEFTSADFPAAELQTDVGGHGAQGEPATGHDNPRETPAGVPHPRCNMAGTPSPRDQAVIDDFARQLRAMSDPRYCKPCDRCGQAPTRRFMNARLCRDHAPTQPAPDPNRTAAALSARRDLTLRAHRAQLDRRAS